MPENDMKEKEKICPYCNTKMVSMLCTDFIGEDNYMKLDADDPDFDEYQDGVPAQGYVGFVVHLCRDCFQILDFFVEEGPE